jgi:hypothetical protein
MAPVFVTELYANVQCLRGLPLEFSKNLRPTKKDRSYFLPGTIASLAALATRILTTVLAGILIASPVAGWQSAGDLGRASFLMSGRGKEEDS